MGRLDGKVAIVTGAGQGLGRAIATRFADEGAAVTIAEKNPETCETAARELRELGARAIASVCDVSDRADVDATVARTIAEFGQLDILVNNAQYLRNVKTMLMDTTEEHLLLNVRSGLFGVYFFMQACQPYLKLTNGFIVNMGAAAGVRGGDGFFAYACTKEAIRAATRVAAREFAPDRINVNAICPVAVDTPAVVGFTSAEAAREIEASMAERSPLGRAAQATDVAGVALFLVSEEGSVLTGHTIMADGGLNMDAGR